MSEQKTNLLIPKGRKNYSCLDKLSLGNLILALEADLDSIQLQLQPRYSNKNPFPRNIQKIRMQIRRCLAISRRLQAQFPQEDYTLNRCNYTDELPNQLMSDAKKDWYRYKRKQVYLKTQAKLVFEGFTTLDATAGKRGIWRGINTYHVIFLDVNRKVEPTIVASNEYLPFKDESFSEVIFDPPQFVLSQEKNALPIHKQYGFWLKKEDFFNNLKAINNEFFRVLKSSGLLRMKFCTFNFELSDTLAELSNFVLIKNDSRPTKGRGKNTVHWLFLKKREVGV